MLTLTVPGKEYWDQSTNEFKYTPETVLHLEHSLASLSKWEEIFKKPFLSKDERTSEEALAYVIAMTLTEDVPADVYSRLSAENAAAIDKYINDSRTATWFNDKGGAKNTQTITSELLYAWMFQAGVDIACENWHLSRLITLLRTIRLENEPKKKTRMDGNALSDRARENARRKAMLESSG